jgi:hypothetical protein
MYEEYALHRPTVIPPLGGGMPDLGSHLGVDICHEFLRAPWQKKTNCVPAGFQRCLSRALTQVSRSSAMQLLSSAAIGDGTLTISPARAGQPPASTSSRPAIEHEVGSPSQSHSDTHSSPALLLARAFLAFPFWVIMHSGAPCTYLTWGAFRDFAHWSLDAMDPRVIGLMLLTVSAA